MKEERKMEGKMDGRKTSGGTRETEEWKERLMEERRDAEMNGQKN